jgi:dipeptidyl aminopeptidase/acylaminoacyl peptidase
MTSSGRRPDASVNRLPYGRHPEQFLITIAGPYDGRPSVLLVHGGFWRPEKDAASLLPAAQALAARGLGVASIEYRNVESGGGWPVCADDVTAAVATYWSRTGADPATTVLVGHSAGGHLALVAAAGLDGLGAVVGLAAVSDLVAARDQDLGDGAVRGLLGAGAEDDELLWSASPLHQGLPRCPVHLIHGAADQAVPVEQSLRLAAALARRGHPHDLEVIADARHMHLVNVERPAWSVVAERLTRWATELAGFKSVRVGWP